MGWRAQQHACHLHCFCNTSESHSLLQLKSSLVACRSSCAAEALLFSQACHAIRQCSRAAPAFCLTHSQRCKSTICHASCRLSLPQLQQLDFFLPPSSWGLSTTMLVPWLGSCKGHQGQVQPGNKGSSSFSLITATCQQMHAAQLPKASSHPWPGLAARTPKQQIRSCHVTYTCCIC